jgi:diguanylate cyclase (GGDEF)-like protein/PAS domain S-box-containing protein
MMATRRVYQQQFIDSGLPVNDHTVGFLPAHSFSRIAKDFANWNDNGILFNNVSDRPRNAGNQADRDELIAMEWFRSNPKANERMDEVASGNGTRYLLYSAPIWIEPFCLKCHGGEADAPQSIRENYDAAYDYKVGDLRGLVSIKIPTNKFETRFYEIWGTQAAKSLIGYLLLFIAIGYLMQRLVMRRLWRLQAGADRIAAGDYEVRMRPSGHDEICQLAGAFNHMAEEVQAREQTLSKLSLAVEQSPASVIITNLAGDIEYVNQAFVRNTGYSAKEVAGRNPRLLQSNKTPRATFVALWETLLAGNIWHGELTNRRQDGSEFIEHATISPVRAADGTVTHYLAIKQDITDQKLAAAEIYRLAYYDALTNLPNRSLLQDRLGLALAGATRQQNIDTLILINLDRFKVINDAHGHALGDQLLIVVGGRLAALLREGDTLARLAADEFAILLHNVGNTPDVAGRRVLVVTEKIHQSIRLPFRFENDEDSALSVSIGVTLYPDSENDTPQEVLRRADNALHKAKAAGANQTAFFEETMAIAARQRFSIERELRRGIPNRELRIYQIAPSAPSIAA